MTLNNKTTTVAFAVSVFSVIIMTGGINAAYAQGTPEQEVKIERLLNQWLDLYDKQQELIENPPAKRSVEQLTQVDRDMDMVWSQYETLESQMQPIPLAKIDPSIRDKMDVAKESLWDSEHFNVFLGWGINEEEGMSYIQVDVDQSDNITEDLQAFVGKDVPLKVVYQKDVSQL